MLEVTSTDAESEDLHNDAVSHARRSGRRSRPLREGQSGGGGPGRSDASTALAARSRSAREQAANIPQQDPAAQSASTEPTAFLNLPFHRDYERTFIWLISGLTCLGIRPRIVTEIPESKWRLDKLKELIASCDYSFHDLSYVGHDGAKRVPRFNMPFECGLAVGLTIRRPSHEYYVLERTPYRLQASLSDLNGVDPFVYFGTARGIHSALLKAFSRRSNPPAPELLTRVSRRVSRSYSDLKERHGSVFDSPACFSKIVFAARMVLKDELELGARFSSVQ
jgi:hypothetical protein